MCAANAACLVSDSIDTSFGNCHYFSSLNPSSILKDTHLPSHYSTGLMMISKLSFVLFALSAIQVTAFPRLNADGVKRLTNLAKKSGECPHLAKQNEAECPYLAKNKELKRQATFDPTSQHVSTSGEYAWVAPGAGDQRGVLTFRT